RVFVVCSSLCGGQADRREKRPPLRDNLQEVVSLDRLDRGRTREHERLTVCGREECGIRRIRGSGVRLEQRPHSATCLSHTTSFPVARPRGAHLRRQL